MKLDALAAEIEALTGELQAVQAQAATAGAALAHAPADRALRAKARELAGRVTELRDELTVLHGARDAAAAADTTAEAQARREAAAAALARLRGLQAERVKAGAAIDAALGQLHAAVQRWCDLHRDVGATAAEFFGLALHGEEPRLRLEHAGAAAGLISAAGNALAAGVDAATSAIPGIRSHLACNYVQRDSRMPERVARDAEHTGHAVLELAERLAAARGV